jgi:hypothetical protein
MLGPLASLRMKNWADLLFYTHSEKRIHLVSIGVAIALCVLRCRSANAPPHSFFSQLDSRAAGLLCYLQPPASCKLVRNVNQVHELLHAPLKLQFRGLRD